jgi:hypothetical protein
MRTFGAQLRLEDIRMPRVMRGRAGVRVVAMGVSPVGPRSLARNDHPSRAA